MSQHKYILALVYESENNALLTGTWTYARQLIEKGHHVIIMDLRKPDTFSIMTRVLAEGEVLLAFALQGVGSQLKVQDMNLWTAARTPFIGLHFDHPSHCIANHITDSPYIVSLYAYRSFLETFEKFVIPIRGEKRLGGLIEMKGKAPEPSMIPFKDRPIRLLYMKTGVTTEPYAAHIDALPKPLRDGVWDRMATAIKDPNLNLCTLCSDLFPKETFFDPDNQVEFWAIVQAMDLYVRHKRAIDFIEWAKHQEGAVIVGNGWDAIDKTHAKATFKPSMDATMISDLYRQTQFVCNTNPYGNDMIHERTITGLMTGCAVITDTNEWTEAHMADIPNLVRFNWNAPLASQIEPRLSDIDSFEQNVDISRQAALKLFAGLSNNAEVMVEYAAQARLLGKSMGL